MNFDSHPRSMSRLAIAMSLLRSRHVLPILFLVLVGPTVLLQVYLTPPIQVADEGNHFARATQLLNGKLFGTIFPSGAAGGHVDAHVPTFTNAFVTLPFHADMKIDPKAYAAASVLRWRDGPSQPTGFPNTAIYPFFLYLPASAGLAAGRGAGLSIMNSFYLGRLSTALVSLALGAVALWICGQGRTLLFVILSVPMTTSLFASVSQDAMSIALGALGAALWSQYVARGVAMPAWARAVTALSLGAVVAARLPLAPLYVLALMPTCRPDRIGRPRPLDVVAALVGLVPVAVGIYGAHVAKVPFRFEDGVSASAQLQWIFGHPWSACSVMVRTLLNDVRGRFAQMIGVLGWLDTVLPRAFYTIIEIFAAAAILLDALTPRVPLRRWGWLPLGAVAIASVGVFVALYLAWTPVGSALIEGVQGRYFLVPAVVLALSLPGSARSFSPRVSMAVEVGKVSLCGIVALMELWTVPIALIHRYYG